MLTLTIAIGVGVFLGVVGADLAGVGANAIMALMMARRFKRLLAEAAQETDKPDA